MRALKQFLLGLLLTIAFVGIFILIPTKQQPGTMPWQVQVQSDGNIEVFGIHLGKTNYKQAQQLINNFGETALFTQAEHPPTVEAYFASIHLGSLNAKLVLNLDVPIAEMQEMLGRSTKSKLQPSGARRHQLVEQDRRTILNSPVIGITYIPSVQLTQAEVVSRFGEPQKTIKTSGEAAGVTWLYPAIGLSVIFPKKGKNILQYSIQ